MLPYRIAIYITTLHTHYYITHTPKHTSLNTHMTRYSIVLTQHSIVVNFTCNLISSGSGWWSFWAFSYYIRRAMQIIDPSMRRSVYMCMCIYEGWCLTRKQKRYDRLPSSASLLAALYPLAWRFFNENARINHSDKFGHSRSTRYKSLNAWTVADIWLM